MLLTDPSANSNSDTDTDTDAAGGDIRPKGLTKVRALYMSKVSAWNSRYHGQRRLQIAILFIYYSR